MKKILCISRSCCDLIFGNLPHMPGPGEEVYGDSFTIRPGGGANTPINLARLGAPVTFLTGIGADEMGKSILTQLQSSGIHVEGVVCRPGTRTAVSAVLSTERDRGFASYGGTEENFFTPEQLEEEIRRADIVHTFLGYCADYPIAAISKKYGKELSLDTSWCDVADRERALNTLEGCDWLKVNENEARALTGQDNPEAALKILADLVSKGAVITLGGSGSIGMAGYGTTDPNREIVRQAAVSMGPFRDSCGAGDAYAAGLLWGISQGKKLTECMELGAEISGLCVTWLGGNSETLNCTIVGNRFCIN